MKGQYKVRTKVWLYPGMAGWHFASIPKKESAEIKKKYAGKTRGFGSLRVSATIGKTTWATSIFPDKKSDTYLLPLKAQVRAKEGIANKDTSTLTIKLK